MNKPYTIIVKNLDGWWSAFCPQLDVSGFGASKDEAVEAVRVSMHSALVVRAHAIEADVSPLAELQPA